MSFGFELRNDGDKSLISSNETIYMFYKKVTGTFGNGRHFFNLGVPRSWGPMVYCYWHDLQMNSDRQLYGSAVIGRYESLEALVCVLNSDRRRTVSWYVFLPCTRFSSTEWGLNLWDSSGTLVFHSGRPMLNIVRVVHKEDEDIQTYSFSPAASANVLRAHRGVGLNPFHYSYGYLVAVGTGNLKGTRNVTGKSYAEISSREGDMRDRDMSYHYSVINADYYNGFPNTRAENLTPESLDEIRRFYVNQQDVSPDDMEEFTYMTNNMIEDETRDHLLKYFKLPIYKKEGDS